MKRAAPHTKSGDAEKLIKYYEDRAIKELRFTVNGMPVHVQNIDPECTLLEWLRASGLCGAKLVCGEGGCGACTVSVFTTDIVTGKPVHRSVNSCLVSVCDVSGCEVTTIEGVKVTNTTLHPIQRSLVEAHGSQCGYCTPGMVMSIYAKWADGKRQVEGDMNSVKLERNGDHATIGSAVSLTTLKELIQEVEYCGSDVLRGVVAMLRLFASEHVRNLATLGGNIVTASPISDLNVIWVAAGATFRIAMLESAEVKYRDVAADDFFLSYRKVDLQDNEILVSVTVPLRYDIFRVFKQSRRRQDDLAIVNVAIAARLVEGVISEARVALGGMAPTTIRGYRTEGSLNGHRVGCIETTRRIMETARSEFTLAPATPGGMTKYRMAVARSLLYKFCMGLPAGSTEYGFAPVHKRGLQYYTPLGDHLDPVGKSVNHVAADKQVRGCADFFDDFACSQSELFLDFVLSTQSTGSVISMDFSACPEVNGFVGEVTHKDCNGIRSLGAIVHDEPLFAVFDAGSNVSYCGQILAVVVATDRYAARVAAAAVKVTYSEDRPSPIVSIEDAIRERSFHQLKFVGGGDYACIHTVLDLHLGSNIEEVIEFCRSRPDEYAVVSGRFKMAGQEHFYFETQGARAVPTDGGTEIEVFSSTQNPHETQMNIAEVLGIPFNRVVVRTKRIGGGFGGKETRACILAPYAALAAVKFNRPARFQMNRDVDMSNSGKRHSFLADYTIAVRRADKALIAADVDLYANGGYSLDLSECVVDRGMMHMTNACFVRNVRVTGRVAKTNIESNTAFRGFGGPQGQAVAEAMYEHAACELGITREELEEANWAHGLDSERSLTHYNHYLGNEVPSEDMWTKLMRDSEFHKRRTDVAEFNSRNQYVKRGIAAVPIRFGVSFTSPHLNQASSLITLQKDGSVQVCHVGVEMGQGLNTKISQVVASELGVPVEAVHISEANTSRAANGVATAASVGTDLNANAAVDACRQLNKAIEVSIACTMDRRERWIRGFQEYIDFSIVDPQTRLANAATKAWFDRICLSAVGYYRTPEITGADWSKKGVNTFNSCPFYYYAYGAAASEVEVDLLTGEARVLRVDILHDVGKSLNPAVDIGQIEGAFVQGYGLFCMEEPIYDHQGRLVTRGPGMYKIPSFDDIPCDFRVTLYDRTSSPTIRASKAVGEPPLFGAASVYYAIKEAIYASRGNRKHFELVCPVTPERIRLAVFVPETGDDDSSNGQPVGDKWHAFA
ncbi:xanthine dehydrogenase, putative [Perkinsus marinus ATCC 50983]|uniref:Xanthine dehydrogenase, putative n=1 Tax=Perkinsus marinus (strain ATCC 50983 / TXsc) TaxID=423536 RepID=C5KI51_PERM5|nr:xanthine dehydrogenase, putative [Perkinsus marinus ATCC 50983]EER16263.1 xanthine dehydrogenase, putative [Perkinsus marinus ATCC 50983]|eukprot:XP_002784467.1 xanthine dehydrogenase, putative [Perkinsus marinus ATCC 50983]